MSTENKSVCSCGAACDAKALKASVKKLTSDNAKLSKQLASAQAKASKASATAATKLQIIHESYFPSLKEPCSLMP